MKRRFLVVPRPSAEASRQALKERGWLASTTPVVRRGDQVLLPLTEEATGPFPGGEIQEQELPSEATRPRSYRDLFPELSAGDRRALPRSFDVVGDIVLIRLPDRLGDQAAAIGAALLGFVPGARLVGWDHGVQGTTRRRRIEPLAGTGGWRTRHRENGLLLDVDVERAYFSPRLAREHARIASAVRPDEQVLDLCCGIGPFTLTIARDARAREIDAVDINPDAIELLVANARRLRLEARIRPEVGDLAEFLARAPPAGRVIFNLPHEGIKYLTSVGTAVEPGGTLHFYEIMERSRAASRPQELADLLNPAGGWRGEAARTVHPYSPTTDLLAHTLVRAPGGA